MAFIIPRAALTPARRLQLEPDPSRRVLRAGELAAWRSAEEAVADARAQADAIIAGAQAAFEIERERGYQEGLERARLQQAGQMIENVSRTVDYFAKVEERMVDLVMQAVQKVIAGFSDQDRVASMVQSVLSVVRNQKHMTLRLNATEVEGVRSRLADLLALHPSAGFVDIVADASLKPGACVLESEIGLVEASMEGQIAALHNALRKVLGDRR